MEPKKKAEKKDKPQVSKKELPEIKPGQTIKVHQKIKEGDKERIQVFEGMVIARKGGNTTSATMTVRKISEGIGVEKIFPIKSPQIAKVDIVKEGRVRRSKLYYLRDPQAQLKDKVKAK